ncbi:MAG: hypothetical protein KDA24_22545 [Deltaproteobacteria bacterium]|nr:hypothetical protein [Deltaproteobacteria bacterium]
MTASRLLILLLALGLAACPRPRGGGDDDDAANDDDSASDDDDAAGDDDDATGDDDDATGDDDDDATGDDDDDGGACQISLTFATGSTETCNEPWTEQGVELSLRIGTCGSGSNCSGAADSSGVWVYPAEIYGYFGDLDCTPGAVEIDINDYTGVGAVDAVLYDSSGGVISSATNTMVGSQERLTLPVTSGTPVAFGVSGCETQVLGAFID